MRYILLLIGFATILSAANFKGEKAYLKNCKTCHKVDSDKMASSYSQTDWRRYFAQKGKLLAEIHSKTDAKKYFDSKKFKQKTKLLLEVMTAEPPQDKYNYSNQEKRAAQKRADELLFDMGFCYVAVGNKKYQYILSTKPLLEHIRDDAEELCQETYGCSSPHFLGLAKDMNTCKRKARYYAE